MKNDFYKMIVFLISNYYNEINDKLLENILRAIEF